jgi:hypothetical protein
LPFGPGDTKGRYETLLQSARPPRKYPRRERLGDKLARVDWRLAAMVLGLTGLSLAGLVKTAEVIGRIF